MDCDTLAKLGLAFFLFGAQLDVEMMDFILWVVLLADNNVKNSSGHCVYQHYLSFIFGHRNTIGVSRGVIPWYCKDTLELKFLSCFLNVEFFGDFHIADRDFL